ncbi:MAG: hypothetical protein KF809_16325 [Chloroflexi bacterium]|nr:hypothetical protein [Chloroflexota bacterium]
MAETWNIRRIGWSDLGGPGDGMHVQLHDGYAFVGHMGESGTSILDVRDPSVPRLVARIPAAPNTHAHKTQVQGDILLTNREIIPRRTGAHEAGLVIHDISDPIHPREITRWEVAGKGVHRMTWWEGPLAYVTASDAGFIDQILVILDLSDPARPREVGRWWYPGQREDEARDFDETWRVRLHHAIVRDGLAYCGWWDKGAVILDVRDPSAIAMVGQLDLGHDAARATHTLCPLPGRDVAVTTEERIAEGCVGVAPNARLVDISDPGAPRVISDLPVPEGDHCTRGGRFGPHNVHEPKPGSLIDGDTIYLTYFNGGLRVLDVSDAAHPVEIAWYVPDAPPGQVSCQLNDVTVGADGLIWVTDRLSGGLHILELTAGADAARRAARGGRAA